MKKNFWKNKNVLITGISGFVGSNLAKELIDYFKNDSNVKIENKAVWIDDSFIEFFVL